jgi:hypothetical protein
LRDISIGLEQVVMEEEKSMFKTEFLWARIALILNGLSMVVLYPLNMLVDEAPSWIWTARNPLKAVPLIDFVIVSGVIHATTMFVDANSMPGHMAHTELGGDVIGTYLAPITLLLTHPRRFYIFESKAKTGDNVVQ